jgi:phosphoglycerate dehydrogenase-like enzyme
MAEEVLQIWCNLALPSSALTNLREGIGIHHLMLALDNPATASVEPSFDAPHIAFGHPRAAQCVASPRLRWVHLAAAGYTSFDQASIRSALAARHIPLTTSSSVYREPCAEHILGFMLAEARQLPGSLRHQLGDHAWAHEATRASSSLLRDVTVALVGFGAIARRLAELLAPFSVEVVGVRRNPRGDEGLPMVRLAEVERLLARSHHVVDILPANDETYRFFDRARFGAMRAGAVFYNIGRGSTVDQEALLDGLGTDRLRAAYLDVTDPEPPPPAHPLWSVPNCVITPHAAGGHADEPERLVEHFLTNLARFQRDEALLDRVM